MLVLGVGQGSIGSCPLLSHRPGHALAPLLALAQQAKEREKSAKGISQTRSLLHLPLLQQERERTPQIGQFAPRQGSHRLWMLVVLSVEIAGNGSVTTGIALA